VLKLAAATEPAWADWAAGHRDEILLDHAHCEKKAAGAAVNLIFRHPERAGFLAPLSALAREELSHFEAMLRQLERLRIPFQRQRPGPYGGRLHALVRGRERERLLDTLLCCALIEARSCERLGLLADALDDAELAAFYRSLHAAEARHHRLYVDLAGEVAPSDELRARLAELADHEAEVLAETPPLPRLHGGGMRGG